MLQYFLLFACNKALSVYYSFVKQGKPVSWHRNLFGHYLVMIPLDVSLLGDTDVVKEALRGLPYFKMVSVHEDIFMNEFEEFLYTKRKELFTNLYSVNTKLSEHEILQRVASIEMIFKGYSGSTKMEHLTSFFILDHALPDETVEDIKRGILNCLAFSMKFWNQRPASLSLS